MKRWRGAFQLYEDIVQLKLKVPNGKLREPDVTDMQDVFRIIQSVPSPKVEPFKIWLAEVGKERIDEIIDLEITISDLVDIIPFVTI